MTALAPRLRPLDEQVLGWLDTWRGRRAIRVAEFVYGCPAWRCDRCQTFTLEVHRPARDPLRWLAARRSRCYASLPGGGWCDYGWRRPVLFVTNEQVAEVREVLRGLERVGLAYQAGGWWRRV